MQNCVPDAHEVGPHERDRPTLTLGAPPLVPKRGRSGCRRVTCDRISLRRAFAYSCACCLLVAFPIVITLVMASMAAYAQGVSKLDLTSTLIAVASWKPQQLLEDPPSMTASLQERALFPAITACVRQTRAQLQAQVPGMMAQAERLNRMAQQYGLGGSGTTAGLQDATNWVRVLAIVDDALNNPSGLASSPSFVMQKNATVALEMLLRAWNASDPRAAALMRAQLEQMVSAIRGGARQLIATSCGWAN